MTNDPTAPAKKVHDKVIDSITQGVEVPDGVDARALVRSVLSQWNNVQGGDPVGMVRRDDASNSVAHRVIDQHGRHLWRVSTADGTQYNDEQAVLGWTVLYTPPEESE